MSPNVHVSLVSNTEAVTIKGGSFNLQTTIRSGLAPQDLNKLCDVLHSANAKQNDNLAHIVESQMQKYHQNAVSSASIPAHALVSRIHQLVRHLPAAHRELAQQFAGTVRPHTTIRSFRDNLILVATPLLSSSIFSTLSVEVQFLVFYFLVAMISADLFHPRLTYNQPSSRVSVLDALGKYHDFPWSACANPRTFHTEFLRRFLNQTGFSFVKSRLYEVEYDGCIMKPDDWAAVKPFTDLLVDFIQIQQEGRSRMVRCPWCRKANLLPFVPDAEESATSCSCSGCGRDFSAALDSSVEDTSDQPTPSLGSDTTVSLEICRFRIRILKQRHDPNEARSASQKQNEENLFAYASHYWREHNAGIANGQAAALGLDYPPAPSPQFKVSIPVRSSSYIPDSSFYTSDPNGPDIARSSSDPIGSSDYTSYWNGPDIPRSSSNPIRSSVYTSDWNGPDIPRSSSGPIGSSVYTSDWNGPDIPRSSSDPIGSSVYTSDWNGQGIGSWSPPRSGHRSQLDSSQYTPSWGTAVDSGWVSTNPVDWTDWTFSDSRTNSPTSGSRGLPLDEGYPYDSESIRTRGSRSGMDIADINDRVDLTPPPPHDPETSAIINGQQFNEYGTYNVVPEHFGRHNSTYEPRSGSQMQYEENPQAREYNVGYVNGHGHASALGLGSFPSQFMSSTSSSWAPADATGPSICPSNSTEDGQGRGRRSQLYSSWLASGRVSPSTWSQRPSDWGPTVDSGWVSTTDWTDWISTFSESRSNSPIGGSKGLPSDQEGTHVSGQVEPDLARSLLK